MKGLAIDKNANELMTRYGCESKRPPDIQRRLAAYLIAGTTVRLAADLLGINRHSATLFFHKLRERIAANMPELPHLTER